MNRRELEWLSRIRKRSFALSVNNPCDINSLAKFHNEQVRLKELSDLAIFLLLDPLALDGEIETAVKKLEETYNKYKICIDND